MENLETVTRRAPQIDVWDRKRANETVKPFVNALKSWNAKAAFLRGRVSFLHSSKEDRRLARLESGALLAEIRHRQRDFLSAIKGEPSHGRLDDVEAAFERLIEQLEGVSDEHRDAGTN